MPFAANWKLLIVNLLKIENCELKIAIRARSLLWP